MTEEKKEIVVEYLKSLREEISLRIREHTRLVWIKIVSLGAIISFLITQSKLLEVYPLSSYLVWIIPLAAVIFDMLIAGNLRVINNLGYYIKNYIEGEVFDDIKRHINEYVMKNLNEKHLFNVHADEKLKKDLNEKNVSKGLKREFKANKFLLSKKAKVTVEKEGGEGKWKIADEEREFIIKEVQEKGGEKLSVYIKTPEFGFWEEKAGHAAPEYRCYTLEDMVIIWSFTGASGVFSGLLRAQIGFNILIDTILAGISVIVIFIALGFLIRSIRMERRF